MWTRAAEAKWKARAQSVRGYDEVEGTLTTFFEGDVHPIGFFGQGGDLVPEHVLGEQARVLVEERGEF